MQQTVDISGILAAKARRRQALAALSWEEKVAIVEQMRGLLPQGQWKHRTTEQELADAEIGKHGKCKSVGRSQEEC